MVPPQQKKNRFGLKTLVFTVFSDKQPESARTLSCQAVFFSFQASFLAKKLSAKLNKLLKTEKTTETTKKTENTEKN